MHRRPSDRSDDGRREINLGRAFAGQTAGIPEVADEIRIVRCVRDDPVCIDHETDRVECAPNPFQAKVLPMSSE